MNSKIVYKKTSEYDKDSSTYNSDISQIDLDDSVISVDIKTDLDTNNYQIHKNNLNLRNDINRELIKDFKNNINSTKPIINYNYENENKDNNYVKNEIKDMEVLEYKYVDKFINFMKINNFNIEHIENINLFGEIIKLFIIKNNLNEEEIKIFIDTIYKYKPLLKSKITEIKNISENYDITDKKNIGDIFSDNDEPLFLSKLINTWIFFGIILISFIIIIMVTINKK